ncbi:MAG TPA: hypothetical protein VFG78_02405 [Gemmatimonadota bacterium]|nr:hypothetical protein [Gemmatimonadota bacterium]
MLRRAVAATVFAIPVAAACGNSPGLVGEWQATSENAAGSSFVFREDGTALWLLPDTFQIRYETDLDASPRALDLSGFEEGPLRGYVLYCIFDLDGDDTMRLDCEPGVASERGAGIRPDEFGGEQTQTFVRRGGGGT